MLLPKRIHAKPLDLPNPHSRTTRPRLSLARLGQDERCPRRRIRPKKTHRGKAAARPRYHPSSRQDHNTTAGSEDDGDDDANKPASERWNGCRPFFLFSSRSTIHNAQTQQQQYSLCPILSFSLHMQSLRYDTLGRLFAFRSPSSFCLADEFGGIEQKGSNTTYCARARPPARSDCYVIIEIGTTKQKHTYLLILIHVYMYLAAVPDWLIDQIPCMYLFTLSLLLRRGEPFLFLLCFSFVYFSFSFCLFLFLFKQKESPCQNQNVFR